ncbi:hypothetical protein HZC07_01240 [Candidatus Micrarchaeota archaeon]|nr:hypothetical protein [Candidatus Micrarchaeota archaeon]
MPSKFLLYCKFYRIYKQYKFLQNWSSIFVFSILLILFTLPSVAFAHTSADQTYFQSLYSNGSSVIIKDFTLTLFPDQLDAKVPENLSLLCAAKYVDCSFLEQSRKMTITEKFQESSGYYTWAVDSGFPYTTYTLTINRLPTDRFDSALNKLIANASGSESRDLPNPVPIELKLNNSQIGSTLKDLGLVVIYKLSLPGDIYQANAGNVTAEFESVTDQNFVTFDLADVLSGTSPIVVKSRTLNGSAIAFVLMLVVLLFLGYEFFNQKGIKTKKRK